jgi:hypothetical protein
VLSFNRRDALRRTLAELTRLQLGEIQIIVVDNASSDGSADMVQAEFPALELHRLPHNVGVAGFNRGVEFATSEFLLILDDDSWPDERSLELALELLRADESLGGIMLHRRHPANLAPEWPFDGHGLRGVQRNWPDFGCGNLLRTALWRHVGGYEERYFLYRNDTDLALKIRALGADLAFGPDWWVWHDSVIASRKSTRWLHLSTRNWIWMARRHAVGFAGFVGAALGYLHAHRLADRRPLGHLAVIRALLEGLLLPAPRLGFPVDGRAFDRLVDLKRTLRQRADAPAPPPWVQPPAASSISSIPPHSP